MNVLLCQVFLLNFYVVLFVLIDVFYYIAPMSTRERTRTETNTWILFYFVVVVNHLSFIFKLFCNHVYSLSFFPFCNYNITYYALRVKLFRDKIHYNVAQTFGRKFVQHYYLTRIAARHDRTRASEHMIINNNYNRINHSLLNALISLSYE